jgi:hypothetical protein
MMHGLANVKLKQVLCTIILDMIDIGDHNFTIKILYAETSDLVFNT